MSTKMATPGLLKITVFWNKGYDVIIFVDDLTNKILSRDSNHIVDVFMWPKFGNCSISMREVVTTSTLYGFDQKNLFFCGKRIKTKKVLGANSYVYRSYSGKTGRGPFWPSPILNRANVSLRMFLQLGWLPFILTQNPLHIYERYLR